MLILMSIFSYNQLNAQCSFTFAATDTAICPGDSVTITALPPPTTLGTTLAAGNNHRGNMFDLVALNTITITGFDAHPMGNTTIEIYYKVGTYQGFEANAGAWTLVGSAAVVAQPLGTATPVPVPVGVTIPAGQTYAFYITSSNVAVSLNYTNGTTVGNVFSQDANLQFLEGAGMEYPFTGGGSTFSPRIWNGNIHYSLPGPTTYMWDTGDTTASITVAPTDTTYYTANVTISGCSTLTDSFLIYVVDPPIVDLGPDALVCVGDTLFMDAGNPGSTYLWSSGGTGQTEMATADGYYSVDVTNAGGCTQTDSILLTTYTPDPMLGPDTAVCGSILLDAMNPGSTYLWSDNSTGQTLNVTSSGTYSVEVTDTAGCMGTDDIFVIISPLPSIDLGPDYSICVNHTTTLDAGSATTYSWSTGDNTQTISLDGATLGVGTHTISVTITDANGCSNTDDVIITVDGCVGLAEQGSDLPIRMYPNPARDNVTLQFTMTATAQARIAMLNNLGQEVMLINDATLTAGDQQFNIQLDELNAGIYFLQVTIEDEVIMHKLVKE